LRRWCLNEEEEERGRRGEGEKREERGEEKRIRKSQDRC
jgi:hypothetical protein